MLFRVVHDRPKHASDIGQPVIQVQVRGQHLHCLAAPVRGKREPGPFRIPAWGRAYELGVTRGAAS